MILRIGRQIGTVALNSLFLTTQLATTPFDWWLSRRIGLRVHIPKDFDVPRGTLVLANHRSLLDPFLVIWLPNIAMVAAGSILIFRRLRR